MLFSFYIIFPIAVAVISIMIRYDHPLKTVLLQDRDILFKPHLAVNRSFLNMTVHINLHTQASFFKFCRGFSENFSDFIITLCLISDNCRTLSFHFPAQIDHRAEISAVRII